MASIQKILLLITLLPIFVRAQMPPSCYVPNSVITPESREIVLTNFNQKRFEVFNGTLALNGGKYALQAENMPTLSWDCELEAAMQEVVVAQCPGGTSNIKTETSFWAFENSNTIDYYANLLSKTEPNYLTFLSNSSAKSFMPNLRAQRVLHDKATKVGCAIEKCMYPSYTPPIPGPRELIYKPYTLLVCTFDSNLQVPEAIYNARTNASTTTTSAAPTTPSTEILTTPFCNSENDVVVIDKAKALSLIEGKEMIVACGMLFGYIEAGVMNPTVLDSSEFASHKTILTSLGLLY